jgi:flagellar basal-body rod modification protein FlgD
MTISAVTAGSPASVKSSSQSLAANFNNFLQLLTTQLQNQDPLAPMDANAFTSQLVDFASVEQAIQTNTKLGELGKLIETSGTASAMGLLGQEVSATTDRIALTAEGDGTIRYRLAEPAAKVQISVLDGNGHVVRSAAGGTAAGENLTRWDGTDANGHRLAAGEYTVRVTAQRADGTAVGVEQFITGTVQGIEPKDGLIDLVIDGASVPMAAVRSIRQPG